MKVAIGQLWREKRTKNHDRFEMEPQTARVIELLPIGWCRVEKVSGCGKARTRTLLLSTLVKTCELVRKAAAS